MGIVSLILSSRRGPRRIDDQEIPGSRSAAPPGTKVDLWAEIPYDRCHNFGEPVDGGEPAPCKDNPQAGHGPLENLISLTIASELGAQVGYSRLW